MSETRNTPWLSRTKDALWHPCTQMKHLQSSPPLPIERGEGPWLVDYEGRRYLDTISSWWVNLFGHANPRINSAITDQLSKIEHVMLAGCTHAPVIELSERLARLTGLGHAFYGSDGASATEIALKMSFHYWRNMGKPGKTGFVSLQNGYHGETIGALSVTDVPIFKGTYAPLLRDSHQTRSPDWRLAEPGESPVDYALRAAGELEVHLANHAESTAAVILEPLVQGAAGMAMYHPTYLTRVRALCDQYQVHLIDDEIAMGFGRTGTLFACEQAGIRPDFMCLSKGITGGYLPLSAVLTTDLIYGAFYDDAAARGFLHSHSYTGNPLACRAALTVLDIIEQDRVIELNQAKSSLFTTLLTEVATHTRTENFRTMGMIWAFEVRGAEPNFGQDFHQRALGKGLFIRPIGKTIYFMPPYVIDEADMNLMANSVLELLNATPRI